MGPRPDKSKRSRNNGLHVCNPVSDAIYSRTYSRDGEEFVDLKFQHPRGRHDDTVKDAVPTRCKVTWDELKQIKLEPQDCEQHQPLETHSRDMGVLESYKLTEQKAYMNVLMASTNFWHDNNAKYALEVPEIAAMDNVRARREWWMAYNQGNGEAMFSIAEKFAMDILRIKDSESVKYGFWEMDELTEEPQYPARSLVASSWPQFIEQGAYIVRMAEETAQHLPKGLSAYGVMGSLKNIEEQADTTGDTRAALADGDAQIVPGSADSSLPEPEPVATNTIGMHEKGNASQPDPDEVIFLGRFPMTKPAAKQYLSSLEKKGDKNGTIHAPQEYLGNHANEGDENAENSNATAKKRKKKKRKKAATESGLAGPEEDEIGGFTPTEPRSMELPSRPANQTESDQTKADRNQSEVDESSRSFPENLTASQPHPDLNLDTPKDNEQRDPSSKTCLTHSSTATSRSASQSRDSAQSPTTPRTLISEHGDIGNDISNDIGEDIGPIRETLDENTSERQSPKNNRDAEQQLDTFSAAAEDYYLKKREYNTIFEHCLSGMLKGDEDVSSPIELKASGTENSDLEKEDASSNALHAVQMPRQHTSIVDSSGNPFLVKIWYGVEEARKGVRELVDTFGQPWVDKGIILYSIDDGWQLEGDFQQTAEERS